MLKIISLVLFGLMATQITGCNPNTYSSTSNNGATYYPVNPNTIPICNQNPNACITYGGASYLGQGGCPSGYVPVASQIAGSGGVACMNAIVLQNSGYGAAMAYFGGPGVTLPMQQCDPYVGVNSCGVGSGLRCIGLGNRQGYCAP